MNKIELPNDPQLAKHVLDNDTRQKELVLKHGWLGKVFGSGPETSIRIAGAILLLLILSGIAYTFFGKSHAECSIGEFWKILLPTIGTLAGYIFGKSIKTD